MPVTNYVWDGRQYLMETDESNTTQAVWTNEPDEYTNLISQHRGVATQYPHFDALGSTRQLTDANETITDAWFYDAWGDILARSGTTIFPLLFAGRFGYFYDPDTETFYIIHRIYEPDSGRWMSVDPTRFADDLNCYRYAANSPIVTIDPSGLANIVLAFPRANNEWSFTYDNSPAAPMLLDNFKPDYRFDIVQLFGGTPPFPKEWGGDIPVQTWQLNNIHVQILIARADGSCGVVQSEKPSSVIDICEQPTVTKRRGVPERVNARITDDLRLEEVIGIKAGDKICYLAERVDKQLGFNKKGTVLPMPGRRPDNKCVRRPATPGDIQQFAGVRGPVLLMQTFYVYKAACCKPCEKFLDRLEMIQKDPAWPGGDRITFELYRVTAKRQSQPVQQGGVPKFDLVQQWTDLELRDCP